MIVAATVADLGGELVEVPPLDGLQPVGDAMQPSKQAPSPWLQKPENQMQDLARVPPPIRRTGVLFTRMPRISQTRSKSS